MEVTFGGIQLKVDQGMVSSTLAMLLCFSLSPDFPIVSRAAAQEGQCPVEYMGYFVRPSVRPSIFSASYGIC